MRQNFSNRFVSLRKMLGMDRPRAYSYVMCILLALASSQPVTAQLTLYPIPANSVTSDVFSLSIDGAPVPVMRYKDYHYAHFGFKRAIAATVTVGEKITSRQIRPNSLGIPSQVTGGVNLSFPLIQAPDAKSTPIYTVVQINDLEKLVLLGDPLEINAPSPRGAGVFNVLNYGADATGAAYTQPALQSAIDAASEFGTPTNPGIVYVPPGVYQVRENLRLKDNVDFYLAPGSVLKADADIGNYLVSGGTIGPVLQVKDASNVTIRGRGEVDASGVDLMGLFSVPAPVFLEQSQSHPRRRIIQTDNARNVMIEGIIAKDATGWSIEAVRSDGVVVQNTKVLNHKDIDWKIQNDGINMTSTSNALVNQSFVITIDDAMCAKARHREVGSMDNVEFSNCVLWTWSAAVKTGMQNDHPMNDVVFRNIDVVHARRAIAMDTKTSQVFGQSIPTEGVLFRDIRVDELNGHWKISNHDAVEFLLEDAPVNNVVIENFSLPKKRPIRTGPNFAANNVTFYNLRMGGELILNRSQISLVGNQPINGLTFAAEAANYSISTGSLFPGAGDARVIAATPSVASPFGDDATQSLTQTFQVDETFELKTIHLDYEYDPLADPDSIAVNIEIFEVVDVHAPRVASGDTRLTLVGVRMPELGAGKDAMITLEAPVVLPATEGAAGYGLRISGGGEPGFEWIRTTATAGSVYPRGQAYQNGREINGGERDFVLALAGPILAGDFNHDGSVNAGPVATYSGSDANGDGEVGQQDDQ